MKYERAMWALARFLYGTRRPAPASGAWEAATPAEKANFRVKADICLRAWGLKEVDGVAVSTALNPTDIHAASNEAHVVFIKSLIERYPEEPPQAKRESHRKVPYTNAVAELAAYAYKTAHPTDAVAWDIFDEADRAPYVSLTRALMDARGFVDYDGSVQISESNGPMFRSLVEVLSDSFALNRVEALAVRDIERFNKYQQPGRYWHCDAPREDRSKSLLARELGVKKAYEDFGNALVSDKDETPGVGSRIDPEVAKIGVTDGVEDSVAKTYPVNEDGAERYDAVVADVSDLLAEDEMVARHLYERSLPANASVVKHWNTLPKELQDSFRAQSRGVLFDTRALKRIKREQREQDEAKSEKACDTSRLAANPVMEELSHASLFPRFARVVYTIMLEYEGLAGPEWPTVPEAVRAACIESVKDGWTRNLREVTDDKVIRALYRIADTARAVADEEKMDLSAFLATHETPVIQGHKARAGDQTVAALAWYAYEKTRGTKPAWVGLTADHKSTMLCATQVHLTTGCVTGGVNKPFYDALLQLETQDPYTFTESVRRLKSCKSFVEKNDLRIPVIFRAAK